jgi:hypothetical protein
MGFARLGVLGAAPLLLALSACGHHFPAGEKLLPQSYGPPFGDELHTNIPHHPHNPGESERHAAADAAKNRNYGSHADCGRAMTTRLAGHEGASGPVAITSSESLGHYIDGAVVHEYRCTGTTLSYRAWHREGHGGEHTNAH